MVLGATSDQTAGLLTPNGTFFAELIAFVLMILILGKYVYPRVMKAATERETKIEAGLTAAAEAERRLTSVQAQVEATLEEARVQAREIINRSHGEATAEAQEVIAKARTDAEALVERARIEIGGERDRAIQDLRNEVSSLVVAATQRLLGETIDAKAHQRLIDEALTKVGDNPASKAQQN
ncbi:MAG TPA: F0F1 ATP synthase subunit B [Candidatus Acidoferrales bacterium]|nr:F0F1 ATP synthase subunit B [Candidatus Acidoferrales bacterium]